MNPPKVDKIPKVGNIRLAHKSVDYYVQQTLSWLQMFNIQPAATISERNRARMLVSSLIEEEYRELLEAEEPSKMKPTVHALDALVDMLWVASNYFHLLGVKYDGCLDPDGRTIATNKFKARTALEKLTLGYKTPSPAIKRLIRCVYEHGTANLWELSSGHLITWGSWAEAVNLSNHSKLWTQAQTLRHSGEPMTFTPSPTLMGMYVAQDEKGKIRKPPTWLPPEKFLA
jgi:hypothetical protein